MTKTIETAVDSEFTISLDENPTTGYKWEPVFDKDIFELVCNKYAPFCKRRVGSGGKRDLTFKLLKSGTYTLKVEYKKPKEKPIKTEEYTISSFGYLAQALKRFDNLY